MKLHIQRDPLGRGITFWIYNALDGIGPYSPVIDRFNLDQIDDLASQRIREFLDVAEDNKWAAYGLEDRIFARAIGMCFQRIQDTMPDIFDEEAVFLCPEPLAVSLSVSTEPILIREWIEMFPPKKEEA